ncbi:MAG: site-specific DNA-methyltransferase, partial [Muribaculaceae bacterium]|nr:site-specific DNA-methyltransferase [Muribaculaceae bacterium]
FAGQVKCIYIDPPYNTGSAFEHYDDNLEHSIWLSLMRERLTILHKLLSKDGSIWVTLDDNEVYYCKVLMDEIFGRQNFVGSIIWEKADSPKMDPKYFSTRHDTILVFAKSIDQLNIYRERSEEIPEHYNKIDEKGKRYYLKPMRVMGGNVSESLFYPMPAPDGTEVLPISSSGQKTCWRWSKKKVEEEYDRIEWVSGRYGWSLYFRIYADSSKGIPVQTIWPHQEAGSNRTSKAEINKLFGNNTFDTPKPEKLIQKVLNATTVSGDIVLDSFLGSGTTAAVAHKMGRRWIGVELGDHAYTHCATRMKKVIEGEQGGISKSVNWQGGGGFKFYELAPSLLNKDKYGNLVINKEYNADMLAAAMAKHQGFTYSPDAEVYWKQGNSSEHDFIFTTTQLITAEMLETIHDQLGEDESLLICCTKFQPECRNKYSNITIKKIPKVLLNTCEFDRNDYSLNIISVPEIDDEEWE